MGALTAEATAFLAGVVRDRRNVVVSGGTGAGKTTLLNALAGEVPPAERVVVIEDTAELDPPHPHVVRLEARPPRRTARAGQVLAAVGFHLKWWLVGRLTAMAAVGLVTGAGLWLVGVPQFLVLAAVAAVLTAVPYIGPILGALPGILVALMQGPSAALWAAGVYTLAQLVENYLITPPVQRDMVNLPPVLAIAAVTLAGALFGVLGLVLAAPPAVAVRVAVKLLYVEDVLGDDLNVPGARPAG